MPELIDIKGIKKHLENVCREYETSAPTVSAWADDLYIRLGENFNSVRLSEIFKALSLYEEGQWEHPNFAANKIYHFMDMLGQDVSGHAGF